MPASGSTSRSDVHQDFLTIRISKSAGLIVLAGLVMVAAAILLRPARQAAAQPAEKVEIAPNTAGASDVPTPGGVRLETASALPASLPQDAGNSPGAEPLAENQSQPDPGTNDLAAAAGSAQEDLAAQPAANRYTATENAAPAAIPADPAPSADSTPLPPPNPPDPPQPAVPPSPPTARNSADPSPARPLGFASLSGAGATFPYPLYSKWFDEFHKLHPEAQFNYQSVGSGAGVRLLQEGTVDFGATDYPLPAQQTSDATRKVLYIPTALGAVVPIYNLPGTNQHLRFTPEILAGIFRGQITSWNDPAILRVNPRAYLPPVPIAVVHRADGSATTFIFSDYLSKTSPEWERAVGIGASLNWPVGLGAKGNEGVASVVRQTPNSLGYVDMIYAEQNRLVAGSIRNAAGRFITANIASVTEAAASVRNLPSDTGLSITNAPGPEAYPIAGFTWLLVPEEFHDFAKGNDMADFLDWMADRGQLLSGSLGYAPLPQNIAERVKQIAAQIR